MMEVVKNGQTQAPSFEEILSLPVLADAYTDTGRLTKLSLKSMKAIIESLSDLEEITGRVGVMWAYLDGSAILNRTGQQVDISTVQTSQDLRNAISAPIIANCPSGTITQDDILGLPFPFISSPSVYQTIVSQTGTAAPAVGGSLSPLNSYPAGTTFTWARTSAGVYTLTASAAVFNTAGKTAIIIGPLNNLNGQYTAVITSTTVITITTAVQSLAFLGLLGFTATPTDAMMTKTAVQVLTYA